MDKRDTFGDLLDTVDCKCFMGNCFLKLPWVMLQLNSLYLCTYFRKNKRIMTSLCWYLLKCGSVISTNRQARNFRGFANRLLIGMVKSAILHWKVHGYVFGWKPPPVKIGGLIERFWRAFEWRTAQKIAVHA